MFSYLVVGDLHLDVKAPSSKRIDDYEEACFDKLAQILNLATFSDCSLIIVTGDWFHRKAPTSVPHRLVNRTLEWLNACALKGIKVLTVTGNHDVQFCDFSQEGIRKQPYGVLLAGAKNLFDISESYYHYDNVTFTGASYRKPLVILDEPVEDLSQFATKAPYSTFGGLRVHVCHASAVDKVPMWKPYTLVSDIFKATVADIIHCGHIHDFVGIISGINSRGEKCYFTNIGSMTRGALTEENLERQPAVLLVTPDVKKVAVTVKKVDMSIKVLTHKPAGEIYDVRAYKKEKAKVAQTNVWAEQLRREFGKAEIEADESFTDLIEKSSVLDYRTRELARGIIDEAGD